MPHDTKNLLFRAVIALAIATSLTHVVGASEDQPQAEILHWWSSAGEARALKVFTDAFEAEGGKYYNSSTESHRATREEAIDRMNKGYPATFTQWNAGADIKDFFEFGLIKPITNPAILKLLKSQLPLPVVEAVSHRGEVVAMPLNVHSDNWMWSSKALIKDDSTVISGDWSAYFEAGDALAEDGIPLLAVGNQAWQIRILFTSVLLGTSRDAYKALYLENDVGTTEREDFEAALNVFSRLAAYSHSFGEGNWDTQVRALDENKAASVFMGDWAKAELVNLGNTPGKEFGCTLTASDDPSLLLVVDAIMLGKVSDPGEIAGQELMLNIVADPETNLQFNALKGSVSPFAEPDAETLDICSEQVYKTFENDEAVLPPYVSFHQKNDFMHRIDTVINDVWQRSLAAEESTQEIVASALDEFTSILEARAAWEIQSENTAAD